MNLLKIQLALDRLTIKQAINITEEVQEYIDIIEVGTSLIKEFGINSVKEMRKSFPNKIILADIKTIDNASYEFEMCFNAGADMATVMGVAPRVSIEKCIEIAKSFKKEVMIDLLNVSREQLEQLKLYKNAILCWHLSKDMQEYSTEKNEFKSYRDSKNRFAMAGGITVESINKLYNEETPEIIIVGSSITKAENKYLAAKEIKAAALKLSIERVNNYV